MRAGGADAVYAMYTEAVKLGVRLFFHSPAVELTKENGRVTGVIAETENGYLLARAEKAVVLATGDIGGNEEMCADLFPLWFSC